MLFNTLKALALAADEFALYYTLQCLPVKQPSQAIGLW
jgi:hypothetical protein